MENILEEDKELDRGVSPHVFKGLKVGDKLFITIISKNVGVFESIRKSPIVSIIEVSIIQRSDVFIRVKLVDEDNITFSILSNAEELPVNGSKITIADTDDLLTTMDEQEIMSFETYESAVKYCTDLFNGLDTFVTKESEKFRHKYGKNYLSLTSDLKKKFDNAFDEFTERYGYTFTDSSYLTLKGFYYFDVLGNKKDGVSEMVFSPEERYDNETKLFAEYVWREKIELKDL